MRYLLLILLLAPIQAAAQSNAALRAQGKDVAARLRQAQAVFSSIDDHYSSMSSPLLNKKNAKAWQRAWDQYRKGYVTQIASLRSGAAALEAKILAKIPNEKAQRLDPYQLALFADHLEKMAGELP